MRLLTLRELAYETAPAIILLAAGLAALLAAALVAGMAGTYPTAAPALAGALSSIGRTFVVAAPIFALADAIWWVLEEGGDRHQDGRHAV